MTSKEIYKEEAMTKKHEGSMKELKCPKCGSVFTVDEADYALILQQVKFTAARAAQSRAAGKVVENIA